MRRLGCRGGARWLVGESCRRAACSAGRRGQRPRSRGSRAARRRRVRARSTRSSSTTSRLRALSRFPVGSSARISRGSPASARAIATRWRSPPESSPGVRSRRSPRPTRSSHCAARACACASGDAAEQQLQRGVLQRRDAGQQMEALVDETRPPASGSRTPRSSESRDRSRPLVADRAALRRQQRGDQQQQRRLARPARDPAARPSPRAPAVGSPRRRRAPPPRRRGSA